MNDITFSFISLYMDSLYDDPILLLSDIKNAKQALDLYKMDSFFPAHKNTNNQLIHHFK